MKLSLALRWTTRELVSGRSRLLLFLPCLAVGVAAVVAVASLSDGVNQAIKREARNLLAADIALRSRHPFPDDVVEALSSSPGLSLVGVKEMASMAIGGDRDRSLLVQLKAVSGAHPLRGELVLEPPRPLSNLLTPDTVVVAPELMAQLGVGLGDELRIGGQEYRIAGKVISEPDRSLRGFSLGPRVFLSQDALDRTPLEAFGSRIKRRLLVRADGEGAEERALALIDKALEENPYVDVQTWRDGQPAVASTLERAGTFLGLVALLSLTVGGVGVARTIRAWLALRFRQVAILKCLGLRPNEVLALFLMQVSVIALLGSVLGAVLGVALSGFTPVLLGDLLPVTEIRFVQPWAILEGIGLGMGITLLFSLSALLELKGLSPARVLRASAEPPPVGRAAGAALAFVVLLGFSVFASLQSGSVKLGTGFAVGLVATTVCLFAGATALRRLVGYMPRRTMSFWLRHGIAALGRPAGGTTASVVALGIGIVAVVAMAIVENQFREQLTLALPEKAPTTFFVDVQPEQWADVRDVLGSASAQLVNSVPMAMGRLSHLNGVSVAELANRLPKEQSGQRWALTREQRLAWQQELPRSNQLVSGELWSEPGRDEVSVEVEYAKDLGLDIGSTVVVDVQGLPVELLVTSLRKVDWRALDINFFLLVEPGVLDAAPHARLVSARLDIDAELSVQDEIAGLAPNVSVVPVRQVLERVDKVFAMVGLGVRSLGSFTVLAGMAILFGVVSAGSAKRGREVALLRTLGATRGQVAAALAWEHALLGFVAGVIGVFGAGLLAWAVLTRGMDLEWHWPWRTFIIAPLVAAVLAGATGAGAAAGSLRAPPATVFRAS